MASDIVPYTRELKKMGMKDPQPWEVMLIVRMVYRRQMKRTSQTFQSTYPNMVRGSILRVLYITTLLAITMSREPRAKRMVKRKKTELPSWNQTLWEKGMLTMRKTMEKRAANVTVPISWYLARRYSGINFFFFPSAMPVHLLVNRQI